jgi:alkanesulfonate monooxygenase SsuD/methylene tetrahydromethanopterin reductase-like flavin-dependent oxidoreductase (luciferase family)
MIPVGFCLGTFGTSYAALREAAIVVDQLGFDSVWVWDHYVSWNDPRQPVLDGWTVLSSLAEVTQQVRLGPLVANNTNRHPGRLAKMAATLHEISNGRLDLGLGAGGLAFEQVAFGIDQGSDRERFAKLKEAIQIIPALWRGEAVSFAGEHYQLNAAISSPAANPPPRLILGALGPGICKLAGRYADGLNLQWHSRERYPELLDALDAGLAASGRTRAGFDLSIHPHWPDLFANPLQRLADWQALGFQRAIVYVSPPFPLHAFEQLARQVADAGA